MGLPRYTNITDKHPDLSSIERLKIKRFFFNIIFFIISCLGPCRYQSQYNFTRAFREVNIIPLKTSLSGSMDATAEVEVFFLARFHKSTVIPNAIKKGVTSNMSPDSLASREGV